MNHDKLSDLSDQIRSQITEFYTISGAFIVANTFASALTEKVMDLYVLLGLLAMNFIWYVSMLLSRAWQTHWIKSASDAEHPFWNKKKVEIKLGAWSVKQWFLLLPFVFSLIEVTMWRKPENLTEVIGGLLVATIVYIVVPTLISKSETINPIQ